MSQSVPSAAAANSVGNQGIFGGNNGQPSTLSALVSQHRLLELSRFGLRGYDLAQHMLTQQGAVSKLLGKFPPQKVQVTPPLTLKFIDDDSF